MIGAIVRASTPSLCPSIVHRRFHANGRLASYAQSNRIILVASRYQLQVRHGRSVTGQIPGNAGARAMAIVPRLPEFHVAVIFEVGTAGARQCGWRSSICICIGLSRHRRPYGIRHQIPRLLRRELSRSAAARLSHSCRYAIGRSTTRPSFRRAPPSASKRP